jgi:hypothetical protein
LFKEPKKETNTDAFLSLFFYLCWFFPADRQLANFRSSIISRSAKGHRAQTRDTVIKPKRGTHF